MLNKQQQNIHPYTQQLTHTYTTYNHQHTRYINVTPEPGDHQGMGLGEHIHPAEVHERQMGTGIGVYIQETTNFIRYIRCISSTNTTQQSATNTISSLDIIHNTSFSD